MADLDHFHSVISCRGWLSSPFQPTRIRVVERKPLGLKSDSSRHSSLGPLPSRKLQPRSGHELDCLPVGYLAASVSRLLSISGGRNSDSGALHSSRISAIRFLDRS